MQRALQRANLTVALIASAAACSGPAGTSEPELATATAALVTPTVTLYLGPKVAQASQWPADADNAAAVGSVSVTNGVSTNPVTIEWAPTGTQTWTNIATENLGDDGWVYFRAASPENRKYRAKYVYGGKTAYSNVETFTWTNDHRIFNDQFNDDTSLNKWELRQPEYSTAAHHPCSKADWSAVAIGGGTLKLKAVKNGDGDPADRLCYKGKANNGHLIAKNFSFASGWAAARIKFHAVQGSHAAFWMTNNGAAPGLAEIDIAESFGKPNNNWRNVYADGPEPNFAWKRKNGPAAIDNAAYDAGFHVYSVRWKAGDANGNGGYYHFYIDDKKVKSLTGGPGIANQPEPLILSMLTSDADYPGWDPNVNYQFEVDWVRVWDDNPQSPASPRPDFADPEPENDPPDLDPMAFTWLQYPPNGWNSPDGTFKLGIGNNQLTSWHCFLDTPAHPVPCTNGNMGSQITIEGTATGVGNSGHVYHVIATTTLGNTYDIYSEGWWGQLAPVVTWTSGPYNGQRTMPAVFTTSIANQPLTTWRCWLDSPEWVVDCSNPFMFSASAYYSGHTMYIETTNYGGTTTTIAQGVWGW